MWATETPAFQALLAKGRESGKVTVAEFSEAVPEETTSTEQIEAAVWMLARADIKLVEK